MTTAPTVRSTDFSVQGSGTGWVRAFISRQLLPFIRFMERTNSVEAKSAPETKPSSGPKLHAAGLPTKCNPGIDDSSPLLRTGYPFTVFTCFDNEGDRKGYRETST